MSAPSQPDPVRAAFGLDGQHALVTGGGSGLGLAIVKAITEAHGGTITVANAPAGGGLVRILLPAAETVIPPTTTAVAVGPVPLG